MTRQQSMKKPDWPEGCDEIKGYFGKSEDTPGKNLHAWLKRLEKRVSRLEGFHPMPSPRPDDPPPAPPKLGG